MTTEQTLEQNKAFIRHHFEEFVNRQNAAIAYQNFAPDFLDHDEPYGESVGPEPAKQMMEAVYVKYPDLQSRWQTSWLKGIRSWYGMSGVAPMPQRANALSLRGLCFGA